MASSFCSELIRLEVTDCFDLPLLFSLVQIHLGRHEPSVELMFERVESIIIKFLVCIQLCSLPNIASLLRILFRILNLAVEMHFVLTECSKPMKCRHSGIVAALAYQIVIHSEIY